MADLNSVNLTGRFTKAPELRKTTTGKSVCQFTLAVNEGKDICHFPRVIAWNKAAESIYQYMKKGSRIGITGRLQTHSWNKNDGTTEYSTDIVVDKFVFLDGNASNSNESTGSTVQQQSAPPELDITDDDLPY